MRSDIVPGAVLPGYELPDHTAKRRKLSELQGQHPIVLILSRGGFRPKDRRQHEGLVQLHRELEVGYCRLVTMSTDNITETNEYRSGVGAHWPFLTSHLDRRFTDADFCCGGNRSDRSSADHGIACQRTRSRCADPFSRKSAGFGGTRHRTCARRCL